METLIYYLNTSYNKNWTREPTTVYFRRSDWDGLNWAGIWAGMSGRRHSMSRPSSSWAGISLSLSLSCPFLPPSLRTYLFTHTSRRPQSQHDDDDASWHDNRIPADDDDETPPHQHQRVTLSYSNSSLDDRRMITYSRRWCRVGWARAHVSLFAR